MLSTSIAAEHRAASGRPDCDRKAAAQTDLTVRPGPLRDRHAIVVLGRDVDHLAVEPADLDPHRLARDLDGVLVAVELPAPKLRDAKAERAGLAQQRLGDAPARPPAARVLRGRFPAGPSSSAPASPRRRARRRRSSASAASGTSSGERSSRLVSISDTVALADSATCSPTSTRTRFGDLGEVASAGAVADRLEPHLRQRPELVRERREQGGAGRGDELDIEPSTP